MPIPAFTMPMIVGGLYSLEFVIALEVDESLSYMPLDRQRRQIEREGLVISTQAMWDQEDALADLMEPSYLKLLETYGARCCVQRHGKSRT